jgi:tape measure domain-containing protein
MATLQAAIDATRARSGGKEFDKATKSMDRSAEALAGTLERLDKQSKETAAGQKRMAKSYNNDATAMARSSKQIERSGKRMAKSAIYDASAMARSSRRTAKTVVRSNDRMKRSSLGLSKATSGIRNAFLALGVTVSTGLLIRGVVRLVNEFQGLQNRIRVVVDSSKDLTERWDQLSRLAHETRTDLSTNVQLFQRLTFATKEAGTSVEDLLTVQKALNQAVIISGAGTVEATNALRQLSQALARGVLRGDEFRSVSEQLPEVMRTIAKSMKVPREELIALAEQGRITSDVILRAFLEFGDELNEEFLKTVPTLAQNMSQLNTEFLQWGKTLDALVGGPLGDWIKATLEASKNTRGILELTEFFRKKNEQIYNLEIRQKETPFKFTPEDRGSRGSRRGAAGIITDADRRKEILRLRNLEFSELLKSDSTLAPKVLKTKMVAAFINRAYDPLDLTGGDLRAPPRKKPDIYGVEYGKRFVGPPENRRIHPDDRGAEEPERLIGPPFPGAQAIREDTTGQFFFDPKEQAEMEKALNDSVPSVDALIERMKALNKAQEDTTSATVGLKDFQAALGEQLQDNNVVFDFAATATGGFGRALGDLALGTATVKQAFRSMADSIVREMARIIAQKIAFNAIQGALSIGSLFGGGTAAGSGPIPGPGDIKPVAAHGGTFSGPSSGYPVMLHGTERVTPLSPVTKEPLKGGGGGGTTLVTNNVFNVSTMDSASFDDNWRAGFGRNAQSSARITVNEIARTPELREQLG